MITGVENSAHLNIFFILNFEKPNVTHVLEFKSVSDEE